MELSSLPISEPLADFGENSLRIRGKDIRDVMRMSFPETIAFMLLGQNITRAEGMMIDALLSAWCDHGTPPPSTQAVRLAASVGASFAQALTAALACFGNDHVPIERAAKLLFDTVELGMSRPVSLLKRGVKLAGFGHPVHSTDPRVEPLRLLARELCIADKHAAVLREIESLLDRLQVRARPNLAGITAALWLDLGFPIETVGIVPIIGRSVGLAAHYAEQRRKPKKFLGTP